VCLFKAMNAPVRCLWLAIALGGFAVSVAWRRSRCVTVPNEP